MARQKQYLHRTGRFTCMERVTESTTVRQNLPNGKVIRTDEKGFWITPQMTYYGQTPPEWNRQHAYYEDYSRSYEFEADYE
jgi:hypothetical protein